MEITRFLKIKDELIDLMYVDEIINETYKGGDLIIRNSYDVSHRFTLNEKEGYKLYNFIHSYWEFFKHKRKYKITTYNGN